MSVRVRPWPACLPLWPSVSPVPSPHDGDRSTRALGSPKWSTVASQSRFKRQTSSHSKVADVACSEGGETTTTAAGGGKAGEPSPFFVLRGRRRMWPVSFRDLVLSLLSQRDPWPDSAKSWRDAWLCGLCLLRPMTPKPAWHLASGHRHTLLRLSICVCVFSVIDQPAQCCLQPSHVHSEEPQLSVKTAEADRWSRLGHQTDLQTDTQSDTQRRARKQSKRNRSTPYPTQTDGLCPLPLALAAPVAEAQPSHPCPQMRPHLSLN